jgi:hypothetical protein
LSPVLQALVQYFVEPKKLAHWLNSGVPGEIAIAEAINHVLADMRTDRTTLNRKASLLLKPLSHTAGGYLPGYLAVKSLWRVAARTRFKLANETDSFVMYLRSYLYDDWGLVAALLEPSNDEVRAAEGIVSYLSARLNDWEKVGDKDFEQYEEDVASGAKPLRGLRTPSEVRELAVQRMESLRANLIADADQGDDFGKYVRCWNVSLLQRRQFMNVASGPVAITIGANGAPEVRSGDGVILRPARSDFVGQLADSQGTAQLEVIFTLRGDRFERAAVAHRGEDIILCSAIGLKEHSEETRTSVLQTFKDRSRLMETEATFSKITSEMRRASWFSICLDHCETQTDAIMDEFFKDVALRFSRNHDAIDSCAAAMSSHGLLPLLRRSTTVRGLALLGLATSLDPKREFIASAFAQHGLSLEDTLRELSQAYDEHGYPPQVLDTGDAIFTTV